MRVRLGRNGRGSRTRFALLFRKAVGGGRRTMVKAVVKSVVYRGWG